MADAGPPVARHPRQNQSQILNPRQLRRLVRLARTEEPADEPPEARPRTRADCEGGPRPCVYVSCRYHLYLDPEGSRLRVPKSGLEPGDLTVSCALDVADRGPQGLRTIASLLRMTHERVRQIEEAALATLGAGLVQEPTGARQDGAIVEWIGENALPEERDAAVERARAWAPKRARVNPFAKVDTGSGRRP